MQHHFRWFLIALLITGFLPANAKGSKSPNVIVVVTDDQGYGDMACHGNPWLKTPAMDQLFSESMRLTDFHVDPTCAPTRAALMTGRYSARTGVWLTFASRHHLRRDEITMADVFRQNGYTTAIFGKWHLGDNYPFRPMDRGFDESLIHGGGVVGETPDYWNNNYFDDIYLRNGVPEKVQGFCTDVWFDQAKNFIDKNREKPFFLYIPTNTPHGPLYISEKYTKSYEGLGIRGGLARFYGTVANIDENLGKLRKHLAESSLDRDTILIFFNDNGTGGGVVTKGIEGVDDRDGWEVSGYNAGMRGKKASHYEGGHRAACFIHWPKGGLTGGRDVNDVTAHIDLLPTLVDLCDLKFKDKARFDGVSLAGVLKDPTTTLDKRTVIVHDQGRFKDPAGDGLLIKDKEYSVMQDRWRLVGKELYNLSNDPSQKSDLASKHPEVVSRLQNDYEKWWQHIAHRSDEFCSFVINPSKQKSVMISSQNLLGGYVAYSQRHVRKAMSVQDAWTTIDVEVAGKYRIELRRWPREADAAICGIVDPYPIDPSTHKGGKIETVKLEINEAHLKVGNFDKAVSVSSIDKAMVFEVDLPKGELRIESSFTQQNGEKIAAYYTYIEPSSGRSETPN